MTELPGPNEEVLEAQARVCTGPHQTRPLGKRPGDPDPGRVLELIVQSERGKLGREAKVSRAQMGAFFAAMTIRKGFGKETAWSEAEMGAMARWEETLRECLPSEVWFLLEPEAAYTARSAVERAAVGPLRGVLNGEHLSYDDTLALLRALIAGELSAAWGAALLIGQRMNLESYEEIRAYADAVYGPEDRVAVDVDSLTHFGQPYDGATRYLRPTVFVAAVRAAQGRPSVLHGVDEMPPKSGVTEEGVLRALGAGVDLSVQAAARLVEDPEVGFAYVSQREFSPGAYGLRDLRVHIKKRPVLATTEKAARLMTCRGRERGPGRECMVVGFYHPGYEEPLLHLMRSGDLDAGLVIKGEEGSSHYSLRLGQPSTATRKAINFTQGFRRDGDQFNAFSADVDPRAAGFDFESSPRFEDMRAVAIADAGMAALSGARGAVYDRILLNAGIIDFQLGFCDDADEAVAQARGAMDSGAALMRLRSYLRRSRSSPR